MAKDYTDFIIYIFGAGHRVFHIKHLRQRKDNDLNMKTYPFNGYEYVLELDRSYPIRWAPWSWVIRRRWTKKVKVNGLEKKVIKSRVRILASIVEVFRSKKIGLLPFQMPCTHQCSSCQMVKKDPDYCKQLPDDRKVYSIHISRLHQPSGELRG